MRATCLVVVLALAANTAHADGLFFKLPKDGTWATYQFDSSGVQGGQDPANGDRPRGVGRAGQGRWTDLSLDRTGCRRSTCGGEGTATSQGSAQIPDPRKVPHAGRDPQDHVLRAWRKLGDGKPQTTEEPNPILAGPAKDAKHLDKLAVESKLGKLACEGVVGSIEIQAPDATKFRCLMKIRLHPDAPFGLVTSHWAVTFMLTDKSKEGARATEVGTMEMDLKLVDFGDKAVSEMPDANGLQYEGRK